MGAEAHTHAKSSEPEIVDEARRLNAAVANGELPMLTSVRAFWDLIERGLDRYQLSDEAGLSAVVPAVLLPPDYFAFYEVLAVLAGESGGPNAAGPVSYKAHHVTGPAAANSAFAMAFSSALAQNERALRNVAPAGEDARQSGSRLDPDLERNWRRGKMLNGYLTRLDARAQDHLRSLVQVLLGSTPADIGTADLEGRTQAELRTLFFLALDSADHDAMLRVLGALRMAEHDSGEVDYLTGLAYLTAEDYRRALSWASRTPPEAIDWPRAQAVLVEARASLGDADGFLAILNDPASPFQDNPSLVALSAGLLLWNCPDHDLEPVSAAISTCLARLPSPSPSDGDFSRLQEYRFSIINRLAREVQRRRDRDAATGEDTAPSAYEERATAIVGPEITAVIRADPSQAGSVIGELFSPRDGDLPRAAEILQCQLAFVEFDQPDEAVAVGLSWLNLAIAYRSKVSEDDARRVFDVCCSTRVEALEWESFARGEVGLVLESDGEESVEFLSLAGIALRFGWKYPADIEPPPDAGGVFRHALTPMGRLSYDSAVAQLHHLEKHEGSHWDAGMISLGFFRILEVEFNELLAPTLQEGEVHPLAEGMHQACDGAKDEATSSTKRRSLKSWERLAESLRSAKRGALDLGALDVLIGKAKGEPKEGAFEELHRLARGFVTAPLSPEGVEALDTGQISEAISDDARNRYRNPPAHSRYLPVETARQCRLHVERTLTDLQRWRAREE